MPGVVLRSLRSICILIPGALAFACFASESSLLHETASPPLTYDDPRTISQQPAILARSYADIAYRPISFSAERDALTLEYIHRHIDPERDHIYILPRMVVIHWTATATAELAFQIFNRETAHPARVSLYNAGRVNVSVPFLVDRDGTMIQMMPENKLGRHCIGLNHLSIGIENVGGPHLPLTDAQLEANLILIQRLREIYPIEKVIGHSESGLLIESDYYVEMEADYFAVKPDPGNDFIHRLRARLDFEAAP